MRPIVRILPFRRIIISIHAPMKDATKSSLASVLSKLISIHAPMKDATQCFHLVCDISMYFNPRTHEGCDFRILPIPLSNSDFNPRTHEGCDASLRIGGLTHDYFNPRTHEGCDIKSETNTGGQTIFQSTHP